MLILSFIPSGGGVTFDYYYDVFLGSPQYLLRFWKSVGISVVLLGGIAAILHFVSLPSSLLPPEHITDLWFYGHDFGQAFPALERFGEQFERGNRLVIMQTAALFCNLGFMAVGAGIGYLIARVEEFYMEEICVQRMRRGELAVTDGG